MNKTTKIRSRNFIQFLIHFIAWGLVFVLPFIIFDKDPDFDIMDKMSHHAVWVLSLLVVFYSNYFLLIEKILFHRKIGKFVLYNVTLVLSVALVIHFWQESIIIPHLPLPHEGKFPPQQILPFGISFVVRDILTLLVIVGLSVAVKMTAKWYKTEVERQEEEKKHTEAELTNLRQQLNPHFLFNTLNNIYALIAISPEKAQNSMLELSKLLRYVLYENNDNFVSVEHELSFIHNYVELMRIRLNADVDLKVEINIDQTDKMIAPLLFIALIENAFKHGVSPSSPSFIHIDIHELNSKQLTCMIRNSYFPKTETDKSGSGIGLENLRRRLEILYPHKHIIRTEKDGDTFISELIIPLNNQEQS